MDTNPHLERASFRLVHWISDLKGSEQIEVPALEAAIYNALEQSVAEGDIIPASREELDIQVPPRWRTYVFLAGMVIGFLTLYLIFGRS